MSSNTKRIPLTVLFLLVGVASIHGKQLYLFFHIFPDVFNVAERVLNETISDVSIFPYFKFH